MGPEDQHVDIFGSHYSAYQSPSLKTSQDYMLALQRATLL